MYKYGKQYIDQNDVNSVVETLKSDWLTQGPKAQEFEETLKAKFGAEHCCAVANGTAALHLTALGLGWQPGDIIITTPITFLASSNCIVYSGATPDFVDIDPVSYTIDPNKLEEKVKTYHVDGKKVRAVVAVDYAGHPCDWEALQVIADKYELQLVDDNCHALGASYRGDTQFAVKYADAVIQSYHPVKHFTTGEGGAVLTNDLDLDERVRRLRTHGITKDPDLLGRNDGPWYYEMYELGYNYRITDFQCALGISQLNKLDDFVKRRREIASQYDEAFRQDNRFITPAVTEAVQHAYHLYPLQIKFAEIGLDRKELFDRVEDKGISLQVHYIPVHMQPYYRKNYGYEEGDFPAAVAFYEREVSIPMYPALDEEDVNTIISSIDKAVRKVSGIE